jgi:hypothetical protein
LSGVGIGGGVLPHFAKAEEQQPNDNTAAKKTISREDFFDVMAGIISRERLFVTKI